MKIIIALIGAIGVLGFIGSGVLLFACWVNYVFNVRTQKKLKPDIKPYGKVMFKYSIIAFLFFIFYDAIFVILRILFWDKM